MLQGHARLAEDVNIRAQNIMLAQNGDILELTADSFRKTGSLNWIPCS
jgi:mRNA degradation ribonuclease J1/J2